MAVDRAAGPEERQGDGGNQHTGDDHPRGDIIGTSQIVASQERHDKRQDDSSRCGRDNDFNHNAEQGFQHGTYHGNMKQLTNCHKYCCERIAHSHRHSVKTMLRLHHEYSNDSI